MNLHVDHVHWNINGYRILDGIDLKILPGEFVGLIGPNGSGKSTLLRSIYRVIHPQAGLITLNKKDVWKMSPREIARQEAVVLQERPSDFDFTVFDMVMMGRSPHKNLFDQDSEHDYRIVTEALEEVGLQQFANRTFHTLSGGEKQRTLLARALAQQAKFLVLDEPTNHLDIRHQLDILKLVKRQGITTIAALHDLNLAALYCSRIYVLKQGKIVTSGSPYDILSSELIQDVYGVKAEVNVHFRTNTVHVIFFPDENVY